MITSLGLYIRTLIHLKPVQLFYRFYYGTRSKYRNFVKFRNKFNLYRKGLPLKFTEYIPSPRSYDANTFTFLNKSVSFSNEIDWDYATNGKLWTYNLNYFDFLNQEEIEEERGLGLMYLFADQLRDLQNANEPYTISLRGMNWIKFISKHNIEKKSLDMFLYSQYWVLMENLEYHILGNHLLENGFSLLFGAYYFNGQELYSQAKVILEQELREQVLEDGAHFEVTPMYHQIILNRVLDCYNLMKNNNDVISDPRLCKLLKEKAILMLGWLETMTYKNGLIPRFNDTVEGIAPTSEELFNYAKRLGLSWEAMELKDSGYRRWHTEQCEITIDIGKIGPDYIPGHAHADTFSFEVIKDSVPFIVDTGISTYNANERRQKERATHAHNTVGVGDVDSSEVWGAFRVGRRAKVTIEEETENTIKGYHTGYKHLGIKHYRRFHLSDNVLELKDHVNLPKKVRATSHAYLHFSPTVEKVEVVNSSVLVDGIPIEFQGSTGIRVLDYKYALGFNKTVLCKMVEVTFTTDLTTLIPV